MLTVLIAAFAALIAIGATAAYTKQSQVSDFATALTINGVPVAAGEFRMHLSFVHVAKTYSYFKEKYGVDAGKGNSGTSAAAAWQSLSKVNSVTAFNPGDQILLKAGSVWNSQSLSPKGSGVSGSPIVIDMYGTGSKPIINVKPVCRYPFPN